MPPDRTPPEILDSYPMPLFFGDKYIWPGLSVMAGYNAEREPIIRAYEQGERLHHRSCTIPSGATDMQAAIALLLAYSVISLAPAGDHHAQSEDRRLSLRRGPL
jgi:hypothetical protein